MPDVVELLDPQAIADNLQGLHHWEVLDNTLLGEFQFPREVGLQIYWREMIIIAIDVNHNPIRYAGKFKDRELEPYNVVTHDLQLTLGTTLPDGRNGVSSLDTELARRLEDEYRSGGYAGKS